MKDHRSLPGLAIVLVAAALVGCERQPTPEAPAVAPSATAPAPAAAPPPAAAAPATGFSIDTLPVSTAALGAFPFFTLPTGYTSEGKGSSHGKPATKEFARFPFRVEGKDHWIEGRFYSAGIAAEEGKTFSAFEVQKNFDTVIGQIGGQKVHEGGYAVDVVKAWGPEITDGFVAGISPQLYMYPKSTSTVWVARRADGNIWVLLTTNDERGGYVIGREAAHTQTSTLISAASLKQSLDSAGKVAVHVNFATDKADILPDSLPQIDEMARLLRDDPGLRVAVNGHTDNTGTAAHNQTLSEARARSVVAALVAKGITAARLTPKGFGNTQPVTDNSTEEGKAKNRRVELVKI